MRPTTDRPSQTLPNTIRSHNHAELLLSGTTRGDLLIVKYGIYPLFVYVDPTWFGDLDDFNIDELALQSP